jgi:oxalate decarboxylase
MSSKSLANPSNRETNLNGPDLGPLNNRSNAMNIFSRRQMLAASGGGLLTTAALVNAQAAGPSKFTPGDGGFARQAFELPPGDRVAYHDPKDVAALPDFRFSLNGNVPRC